jgi:hypothetical protein
MTDYMITNNDKKMQIMGDTKLWYQMLAIPNYVDYQ